VIVVHGGTIVRPLLRATRTVPIVFVSVGDPVAAGFIESLARPGGNATGFATFEYGLGAKWGELLKQIAPSVKRVAVLRDPEGISGTGQIGALQSVAQVLGVELRPINVRNPGYMERAIAEFARAPNGGMIVTSTALLQIHRAQIIALAARHRLPTVYPYRMFVSSGGLVSYGPDVAHQYRLAAGYVDRILKGAKPAELPVQQPTKFELVINLKTAKTLGLEVPPALLTRADEVIE
jgi:putative ABC transport system substrate-binding protein